MGLRERKKVETRAALSWAAIRLTVERGFDNVRVEDIAEAAGVSPRTFNNYFSSKGEAIVARHTDRIMGVAEGLAARPAGEPLWEALREAVLQQLAPGPEVVEHPVRGTQQWTAGIQVMMAEPALQRELINANLLAQTALAAAIASRTGTDAERDIYPTLVAGAVLAATNTAQQHWVRLNGTVPAADLMSDALQQLSTGLPVPDLIPTDRRT